MKYTDALTVAIAAFALATLAGCSPEKRAEAAPEIVRGLTLDRAQSADVPDGVSATGTVQAKETAAISAQMVGRVRSITVREGDQVRPSQLLITLDAAAADADAARAQADVVAAQHQVALAQTQQDLAKSTLARYALLRGRKSVSPQEFDEVSQRAQAASDGLAAAKAQLQAATAASLGARTTAGYSQIRAPFAGVVTQRHVDPGTLANPGMPLLEIARLGGLQLLVAVNESAIRSVQKGMTLPVSFNGTAASLQGRVAEIDPAADPGSRTFQVKIDLPASPMVRAGMSGTVAMPGKTRPTVLVPEAAIVSHNSIHGVWAVDANGFASLRYITIGERVGSHVEVLSGLAPGETVVLNPADRELGGRKIEAAQ